MSCRDFEGWMLGIMLFFYFCNDQVSLHLNWDIMYKHLKYLGLENLNPLSFETIMNKHSIPFMKFSAYGIQLS